jgi:hypothetical protein
MSPKQNYKSDIALIMSKINHSGGNLWATEDKKIWKGSSFSTRDVAIMLSELGFTKEDDIIRDIADLIFSTWRPDGRFKGSPSDAIYPCQTIGAARVLCYLGYSDDERIKKLLNIYWRPNTMMVVGNAINSVLEKVPKWHTQIHDLH